MLESDHYPQVTFSSEGIQRKAANRFEVAGRLTIRGISKPAILEVALVPVGANRLEVDGTGRISLSDYDLKPPSTRWGLVGTKDELLLRFLLWPERATSSTV